MGIFNKIKKLKKELNAIILAHFYQDSDIQNVVDFMCASLALSQYAQKTDSGVIGLTTKIIKHATKPPNHTFIMVTDPDIIHQMNKIASHKNTLRFQIRQDMPVMNVHTCV